MVEGRFEWFVLDQQALRRRQLGVRFPQHLGEPLLALPDVRRAGVIRSVREPHGDIPAVQAARDLDTVLCMLQCALANGRIGIAERTEFVFLVLEKVGVDSTGKYAIALGEFLNRVSASDALRAVPQNVQSYGRANSGEQVHLAGVAEFFLGSSGRGGLNKLSKSCSGIGEAPGRQLDAEGLERVKNLLGLTYIHRDLSSASKVTILPAPRHEFLFQNQQFRIAERTAYHCGGRNGLDVGRLGSSESPECPGGNQSVKAIILPCRIADQRAKP